MRKHVLTLAGAATIALSSAGIAADLPSRAPPPPIVAVPIFTWTGFYVGVNAGWGWRQNNSNDPVFLDESLGNGLVGLNGNVFFPNGDDGIFTGGGQIGYNYQIGSFVLGAEVDIQAINNDSNNNGLALFVPGPAFRGRFDPGILAFDQPDWWGSARVRLGFAIDHVLIYATGGWAFTDNNSGWAAGGGVEWALPVNWFGSSAVTLGLEGLWVGIDQGNSNNNGFVGTFTPLVGPSQLVFAPQTNNNDNEFFVARAKLNFKF